MFKNPEPFTRWRRFIFSLSLSISRVELENLCLIVREREGLLISRLLATSQKHGLNAFSGYEWVQSLFD